MGSIDIQLNFFYMSVAHTADGYAAEIEGEHGYRWRKLIGITACSVFIQGVVVANHVRQCLQAIAGVLIYQTIGGDGDGNAIEFFFTA